MQGLSSELVMHLLGFSQKKVFYIRAQASILQFLGDKLIPVLLFTGCIPLSIVFNISLTDCSDRNFLCSHIKIKGEGVSLN